MQEIKRTSVHDFIYNTIAGTQEISIIGAHNQYVKEPFYEGTPNDLFDNHIDIANELKGWVAGSIWVDNAGVLVITADGGRTEQWLSDYGKSVANVRASSECPQGCVRRFTKYPQGYVEASDVYKVSDNPEVYTNLNFGDMYSELDKDYATTPNAKQFISDSIDAHYYKWHLITKAEADALRAKYLGN